MMKDRLLHFVLGLFLYQILWNVFPHHEVIMVTLAALGWAKQYYDASTRGYIFDWLNLTCVVMGGFLAHRLVS